MAQAATDTLRGLEELDVIVDVDSHFTEQLEDFLPYMDEQYRGLKRIVENSGRPLSEIYSVTNILPPFPENSDRYYTDVHKRALMEDEAGSGSGEAANNEKVFGGSSAFDRSAEAKMRELNEFDIDYAIGNPSLNTALPGVQNTRMQVALASAYNNWVMAEIVDQEDAIKPTIVIPTGKPDLAAEEIDKHGDEDIAGVYVPATGLVPPPGHHSYNPIYEAAERKGLPLLFHGSVTAMSEVFPVQRMWNETYSTDHAIAHPFSQMWNLTSLIIQGVPARYDLDFVLMESGISWVPYMKWRLDDHYLEMPHEAPYLEQLPSEYIDDQFYFTTQPLGHTARDPTHLAKMIELIGPGSVMFASDLPHSDFDTPEELFERIAANLDRESVQGIMGETAADVFGL